MCAFAPSKTPAMPTNYLRLCVNVSHTLAFLKVLSLVTVRTSLTSGDNNLLKVVQTISSFIQSELLVDSNSKIKGFCSKQAISHFHSDFICSKMSSGLMFC